MRNRQEFYRAMLDFEADLDRMMNWSVARLLAVMFAPLLVSINGRMTVAGRAGF